jgi:hypothetical protein
MSEREMRGKQAMRKRLAALSFTEKIKILEKLRDREKAIAAAGLRQKTAGIPRKCFFCSTGNECLTDEHVFPAALGGTLMLKKAVCKTCNGGFNRDFEEKIIKGLEHFRHIFRVPDRRGNVPYIEVKVEFEGKETEAMLEGNGALKLKPFFTTEVHNGVEERVARYVPEFQKEKLRAAGWEMAETTAGRNVEGSFSGRLDFIDSSEMLRSVTKIAYVALAFRMGAAFAGREGFDRTRSYIRSGAGFPNARLFLNEGFFRVCPQGPYMHSVLLAGQNKNHRVDAIVRLFGGLSYFIGLNESYDGADFSDTLVLDAHRGETITVLPTNLQSEFLQADYIREGKETIWDDSIKSGEWFVKFVDNAMQSVRKSL